ncbi:MAG: ATP-binding protein [Patescibacteria group bacterium]|nr:ATP-binding protein [Patescibacteria group bacterium]
MEIFNTIIYIVIVIFGLFLALFVYLKNKKFFVNIFFSLFVISLIGWIATLFVFYNCSQRLVLLVGRLNFAATEMVGYFGFYFGYFFPKKIFCLNKKIHITLFLWLIFLVCITIFTGLISKDEIIGPDGIETIFGEFYFIFILHFVILASLIFVLPLYKYRKVNKLQKQQIKYFALGSSLSIVVGVITNIVLPFIFNYYDLQIFGPISLFFFFGFTSYAIIKHQLLDIKIIIQRGIIYSVLFSVIIAIYLFSAFLLGYFLQQLTDIAAILAALATTMICLYTVPIIEKYFIKKTDKIFFKDKYDYSEAVFALSEILNKNINLDTILKESAKKLKNILKIKNLMIILPKQNMLLDIGGKIRHKSFDFIRGSVKAIENDDITCLNHGEIMNLLKNIDKKSEKYKALKAAEGYGRKFNISLTVPVKLENKLIGFLALGEKLSGDVYTSEDYSLLKTFSIQAGVAMEKTRLYEEVKNYSESLEQKVSKRVFEIKALQEEQRQMMLDISHSLQTPLTIIKGELHNLGNQVEDKKSIEYLEKNLDRISAFIYDMLKLSRMENQKNKFEKEKFNLSELLFDLIDSFKIITQEKNISVKSDMEKNIFLNGSKKEIEEMVMNIVSNSVKYFGDKKNKEINFILKKKNNTAKLIIADTGIGIKKEKISKLFSRFYRAGEDNRGTGLGLAICKEIVHRHLGEIKVESKEGEGVKIIILLPLARDKNKN